MIEYMAHVLEIVEIWAHVAIVEELPFVRELGIDPEILVQYIHQLAFHCMITQKCRPRPRGHIVAWCRLDVEIVRIELETFEVCFEGISIVKREGRVIWRRPEIPIAPETWTGRVMGVQYLKFAPTAGTTQKR